MRGYVGWMSKEERGKRKNERERRESECKGDIEIISSGFACLFTSYVSVRLIAVIGGGVAATAITATSAYVVAVATTTIIDAIGTTVDIISIDVFFMFIITINLLKPIISNNIIIIGCILVIVNVVDTACSSSDRINYYRYYLYCFVGMQNC